MLKLRPSYTDLPTKKGSCKESSVGPSGSRDLKIIFTLVAEVVAVHVWFTIIYIRYFSFKGLYAILWKLASSLVRLQVSLHESFELFIDRERSESRSPIDSREMSGSIATFGGGSWWNFFIFIARKRVMAKTTASAWSGHSLVERWEHFLLNGLADPLGLELLEF